MPALRELEARLPAGRIVTDPGVVAGFRRDEADLVPDGEPLALVAPRDTEEVAAVLAWAYAGRVPVVPRGAGTGLAGGATAVEGCLLLSLAKMTRIREIAPEDQLAVVEAGVINADLGRAVAAHDLMYAPDPSSFEISTIGGNLATNAGGLRCVKYGVTRESVRGLEVVLADGRVIRTGGRTVKNVAGYDLTSLFVGSEGTLGVITAATLRLRPRPSSPPATFVAAFDTLPAAGEAVAGIVRAGLTPTVLELLDRTTIRAVDDYRPMGLDRDAAALLIGQAEAATGGDDPVGAMEKCCREAGAPFTMRSSDPQEAEMLLEARRSVHWAVARLGETLIEDVGVPRSRLPDMLAALEDIGSRHGVLVPTVAHAGDGNLHPVLVLPGPDEESRARVMRAAEEIFRTALRMGGTITGEHGVGALKRPWLAEELGAEQIAVQRAIKTALDPAGILNPGKVL
ncbi:MAG: FAD-binding oxidoreductase [Carbonactinosporaceae bacterium]